MYDEAGTVAPLIADLNSLGCGRPAQALLAYLYPSPASRRSGGSESSDDTHSLQGDPLNDAMDVDDDDSVRGGMQDLSEEGADDQHHEGQSRGPLVPSTSRMETRAQARARLPSQPPATITTTTTTTTTAAPAPTAGPLQKGQSAAIGPLVPSTSRMETRAQTRARLSPQPPATTITTPTPARPTRPYPTRTRQRATAALTTINRKKKKARGKQGQAKKKVVIKKEPASKWVKIKGVWITARIADKRSRGNGLIYVGELSVLVGPKPDWKSLRQGMAALLKGAWLEGFAALYPRRELPTRLDRWNAEHRRTFATVIVHLNATRGLEGAIELDTLDEVLVNLKCPLWSKAQDADLLAFNPTIPALQYASQASGLLGLVLAALKLREIGELHSEDNLLKWFHDCPRERKHQRGP